MKIEVDFNHTQYSQHYDQYLESNVDGAIGGGTIQDRVALFSRFVPKGRKVLEIGAGGGDEALALQNAGYDIIATDYVDKFVELLQEKGLPAILLDAKEGRLPANIDAIYANAVFVHFSPKELSLFLERAKRSLVNEKVLFMSVIKGEGHERAARARGFERDFHYYSLESLKQIAQQQGYNFLYSNDDDPKWIQAVISSKNS
jgi:cyclopropane fatty-acyl-phospholipid synthase-like methyltransferase